VGESRRARISLIAIFRGAVFFPTAHTHAPCPALSIYPSIFLPLMESINEAKAVWPGVTDLYVVQELLDQNK